MTAKKNMDKGRENALGFQRDDGTDNSREKGKGERERISAKLPRSWTDYGGRQIISFWWTMCDGTWYVQIRKERPNLESP